VVEKLYHHNFHYSALASSSAFLARGFFTGFSSVGVSITSTTSSTFFARGFLATFSSTTSTTA